MTRPRGVPTRIWETTELEVIRQACAEHRGNLNRAVDVACLALPSRARKGISQQIREKGYLTGAVGVLSVKFSGRQNYYQEPPPLWDAGDVPNTCPSCGGPVAASGWDNEIAACLMCGRGWHLSRPVARGRAG